MIVADMSTFGGIIAPILGGLFLMSIASLFIISEDTTYRPSKKDNSFHVGFWDVVLFVGACIIVIAILRCFPEHPEAGVFRDRFGRRNPPLAMVLAVLLVMGTKFVLKRIRLKWALDDSLKRKKSNKQRAARR